MLPVQPTAELNKQVELKKTTELKDHIKEQETDRHWNDIDVKLAEKIELENKQIKENKNKLNAQAWIEQANMKYKLAACRLDD